jgi:hypothetical protein
MENIENFKNKGVVNLTPHRVVVQNATDPNEGWLFEPSGIIPRLETIEEVTADTFGIPTVTRRFGKIQNLPEQKKGAVYIVSSLILSACPDRADLVVPDTGATAIRENGQIQAVTRFVSNLKEVK